MPDTNPTPVDLDALEQLTDKATSGPWELHCHGHIESGCRCMSCYACTGWTLRHMPSCDDVAALWDEAERGQPEPGVSCDSDVFIYDDARFIAAAREAIPALIAEVRELRSARAARPAEPCEVVIEPGSPVTEQDIEAARAWTWPYAMPTDPEVRERLDRQLRAAIPGPDSERIHEMPPARLGERIGELVVAALRAAGLLPGPDTITVSREDLRTVVWGESGTKERRDALYALAAALSEPPAPKEQQP